MYGIFSWVSNIIYSRPTIRLGATCQPSRMVTQNGTSLHVDLILVTIPYKKLNTNTNPCLRCTILSYNRMVLKATGLHGGHFCPFIFTFLFTLWGRGESIF